MPKASTIQSTFEGGEISRKAYGLVESARYKQSLALCQNYIPLLQGPITRRPGTAFVAAVKTQSLHTRLIPFEASTEDKFMLEFGNGYIRVFEDNLVYSSGDFVISGITQANPAVVTIASGTLPTDGEAVMLSAISGMTELNNREFTVAGAAGSTFQLSGFDSSALTAYTSGGVGSEVFELATTYSTADLSEIQVTQSNDVLFLVHPSHAPSKITFTGSSFTFELVSILNGPYLPQGYTASGASATLTTGASYAGPALVLTVTANNTNGINGGQGFLPTDVGRLLRLKSGSTWTWGIIYSYSNTTHVNTHAVTTAEGFDFSTASTVWQLGAWSDTTGWPATACFHEDRLVFGGPGATFYGSNSADYENFAPSDAAGTIAANNAYTFSINSNDLNEIVWCTSDDQGLILGTVGSEWLVNSASPTAALSALSVSAKPATAIGGEPIQAAKSGKCTIFVEDGGRKLRDINFYFDVNGYNAEDLTALAEHITSSTIRYIAVQKRPQPIVWAVRYDGVLIAMTYQRQLDALKVGWSRHVLGGTGVEVESVAVMSSADSESQDVWVVVKRTIGGVTTRYIEYITPFFDEDTDLEYAFFVDSGLTYDSTPTSTISGLNHLNGETVAVHADGVQQTNKVVIAGRITLDEAASVVTVGLAYNSDGKKLRTEAGAADGTSMGKTRRTHRTAIMLLDTAGLQLGMDFDALDDVPLNDPVDPNFDEDRGLYSGIVSELLSAHYDFDNMICWRQSSTYPGTIQGFYPQQVTQDRS